MIGLRRQQARAFAQLADMTRDKKSDDHADQEERNSCAPNLSRKDFMALVLKRAAITGSVLAAPKIVDKFLVPPANALTTSSHGSTP